MSAEKNWIDLLENPIGECDHIAQFYQDENFLAEAVCDFTIAGLKQREAVMLIVTSSHARAYRSRLTKAGFNVKQLEAERQLVFLDAQLTLQRFLINGHPDPGKFHEVVGATVSAACSDGRYARLRAHGEMVNLLWLEGNFFGALRLEELWNDLAKQYSFVLLCSYFLDAFTPPSRAIRGVMHTHSHVIPVQDYARMETAVEKAMVDILGREQAAHVKSQVGTAENPWAPPAQRMLCWLHNHMPHSAGDVYLRARRYYHASGPKPATHRPRPVPAPTPAPAD